CRRIGYSGMTGDCNPITAIFRWGSRNRIVFSIVLSVGFIFFATPDNFTLFLGLPITVAGCGVRVWASGHITKDSRLTVVGPYSLSRNPLYAGNFLLGAGFLVASGNLLLFVIFLFIFAGLYSQTIRNEEEHLQKKFPEEWSSYVRSVPRFLPMGKGIRYVQGRFNWDLVIKHREPNNWIVIVIVYLILWAKALLLR
ncbi:MAG: isoprenylcysteine carboxylmethyltransferase family protein, partial [bacterium]